MLPQGDAMSGLDTHEAIVRTVCPHGVDERGGLGGRRRLLDLRDE